MSKSLDCNYCDKSTAYHAPSFVENVGVSCDQYRKWLKGVTKSARKTTNGTQSVDPKVIKVAINNRVHNQREYDFYTGVELKWHLIEHPKPVGGGWQAHKKKLQYPSVDHYNGKKIPDFRICSGLVNGAKGSMAHAEFVELCQLVVNHATALGTVTQVAHDVKRDGRAS